MPKRSDRRRAAARWTSAVGLAAGLFCPSTGGAATAPPASAFQARDPQMDAIALAGSVGAVQAAATACSVPRAVYGARVDAVRATLPSIYKHLGMSPTYIAKNELVGAENFRDIPNGFSCGNFTWLLNNLERKVALLRAAG